MNNWEECWWLNSYIGYEPCNDGRSEYPTGPVYECGCLDVPDFKRCRKCPARPIQALNPSKSGGISHE